MIKGKRSVRAAGALVLLGILSACTGFQGSAHLEDWQVRPDNGGSSLAFSGVLLGSRRPVDPIARYIFNIHGMGSTEDTYNDHMLERLESEFGYMRAPSDGWVHATLSRDHTLRGEGIRCRSPGDEARGIKCLYDAFGKYKVDRFVRREAAAGDPASIADELVVYTYFWNDDLWRVQGEYMNDDIQRPRALINKGLKSQLVDQGFSDAAAYLGPMRSLVVDGIRGSLCAMLSEASGQKLPTQTMQDTLAKPGEPSTYVRLLRDTATPAGSNCLAAVSLDNMLLDTEFSFISHSLGSRMLLDALAPYAGDRTEMADKKIDDKLARLSSQTRTFFMAANQLPLLALGAVDISVGQPTPGWAATATAGGPATAASVSGSGSSSECNGRSFFDCRNQGREIPTAEPFALDVVAFLDPDDILGYEPNSGMGGLENGGSNTDNPIGNIRFVTVVHRNTPQWLGLFTNPVEAHDKELERDSSIRMIFCGAEVEGASNKPKARVAAAGQGCRTTP